MNHENQELPTVEEAVDVADTVCTEQEPPAVSEEVSADVTQRLAQDFLVLAEEFPELISPSQLPEEVLDLAAEQGIALLDAYLRYRLQEEKKIAAAAEKRQQAAEQSIGSLSRGAAETPPEQDAFLRAFRSAL